MKLTINMLNKCVIQYINFTKITSFSKIIKSLGPILFVFIEDYNLDSLQPCDLPITRYNSK